MNDDAIAWAWLRRVRRVRLSRQIGLGAADWRQLDGEQANGRRGGLGRHRTSTATTETTEARHSKTEDTENLSYRLTNTQSDTTLTPAFRSSAANAVSTAANARTPRSPWNVFRRSNPRRTSGFASTWSSAPVARTSTSRRS